MGKLQTNFLANAIHFDKPRVSGPLPLRHQCLGYTQPPFQVWTFSMAAPRLSLTQAHPASIPPLTVRVHACSAIQSAQPRHPVDHSLPQAPLSMGFSRQGHWSAFPFPSPGDLPNPGIEPASPALGGGFFTSVSPRKPRDLINLSKIQVQSCLPYLEKKVFGNFPLPRVP